MYGLIYLSKNGKAKEKYLTSESSAMLKLHILQNMKSGKAVILDDNQMIFSAWEYDYKSHFPREIKGEELENLVIEIH